MSVAATRACADVMEEKRRAAAHLDALTAACAIAKLDAAGRRDLRTYLEDLDAAEKEGDAEATRFLARAIAELFEPADMRRAADFEDVAAEVGRMPGAAEAARRVASEGERFRERYFAIKERSGLRTQRAVAEAAGLSPTTVQAIESGATVPQWRTLERLAAAFSGRVAEGERITAGWLRGE